jgi:hypothetical protein
MTHPAGIVVEDVREPGALRLDLEQLVHLLLVLDDGDGDLGVLQEELDLLRRRVPVHRDRDAPQHLGRADRPVEARPVVADDGEVVAALESQLREAPRQRPDFLGHLRPGPGLPDAHVLLAHRRPIGPHPGVVQEKSGKCVQRGGIVHVFPGSGCNLPTGCKGRLTRTGCRRGCRTRRVTRSGITQSKTVVRTPV